MQLLLNALEEELAEVADFARQQRLGVEITAFAFPANLIDIDPGRVARHAELLTEVTPLVSHGPFLDLIATSRDPEIVAVCRRRHAQSMKVAIDLGARVYVAHTNYTPLIKDKSYRDNFGRRLAEFWLPLADEAGKSGMTIALENLWEDGPEIQAAAIRTANHPHLKASFDNGHALVFSRRTGAEWVRVLGDALAHTHLHDNHAEVDEHLPVGQGVEDWPSLVSALAEHTPTAFVVAESDRLASNKESIERLRGFGIER